MHREFTSGNLSPCRVNQYERNVTDKFPLHTERGLKLLYSTAYLTADNHKTLTAVKTNAKEGRN